MMKRLFLSAVALLLAVAFTACSNEDEPATVNNERTVIIRATIANDGYSRLALGVEDETKVNWTTGDKFTLKMGGIDYTFTLNEGSTNEFTGENLPDAPTAGEISATYIGSNTSDLTSQTGLKADVGNYMTLTSTYTVAEGDTWEDLNLVFDHSTSVVKMTLTNDDFKSADVTDVTLKTTAENVKATSTFTGDATDGSITVYLVVSSMGETEATITATCGGKTYVAPLGSKPLAAGKLYKVTKSLANSFDATDMRAEDLQQTITQLIESGQTTIDITLPANASDEILNAVRAPFVTPVGSGPSFRPEEETVAVELVLRGVTIIPSDLFSYNFIDDSTSESEPVNVDKLKSINLPDAVEIGSSVFAACHNLEEVNAPNVTKVGSYAFNECYNLKTVSMPKVEEIGPFAFLSSSALQTLYFPKLTTIGYLAFQNCSALTEVTFGALVSVHHLSFDIFHGVSTTNISLTLSPAQKVMTCSNNYWTPGETLYKDSEDYTNKSFIGLTFKDITFAP